MSAEMITTIITTYHRPHLLKRAIESVLNQTYAHFKLCVYDNGSDEETSQIMRGLVEKDSRITYHRHPENIGMMGNYKYGYERIDTKYFSFLSDDDYLLPNFYETVLKNFETYPDAGFVACRVIAYNENQEIVGDVISKWEKEGYYQAPFGLVELLKSKGKFPIPTGVLFQHGIIKDVSPDWRKEIQLLWDPDFLLQIASKHPFVITKEICAIYCAHADAFSTEYYQDVFESTKNLHVYITATSIIQNKILDHGSLDAQMKALANQAFLDMIGGIFNIYICKYAKRRKYKEAWQALLMYKATYGINKQLFTMVLYPFFKQVYDYISNKYLIYMLKTPFRKVKKLLKEYIAGKN